MALDRKWEKFRGGPLSRTAPDVRVTLNRKGLFFMNALMYTAMGRPKAVAFYYSREDDAIAIEPAYERFAEHFQVVKKQTGWAIHASTFCRHHKIHVPETERFLRPDLTKEGILILNLKETVNVAGRGRGPNLPKASEQGKSVA